jgi:cytochrome c
MRKRYAQLRPLGLVGSLVIATLACSTGSLPSIGVASDQPLVATSPPSVSATEGPSPAATSERGTPAEAQAMLQKAVDHYQAVGREQALADFSGRAAPFFDRDLYVVCIDSRHIETANGGFPEYVGSSADALLDSQGKPLGKTTWDTSSTTTVNSVSYHWVNPVSEQTEPKVLFFQKVGTEVCGVGAYNPG